MSRKPITDSIKATEKVLTWIEDYIHENELSGGDSLPKELQIAEACGVGRSSVREALTALKVLGIIVTRRKGGIRIVRDAVVLELRHYFGERYNSKKRLHTAMEFRAAMERGLAEIIFVHISKNTTAAMRKVLENVKTSPPETADLHGAETEFHALLMKASGNELASLFSHIYGPIFSSEPQVKWKANDIRLWLSQHGDIVGAIEQHDRRGFTKCIDEHTRSYMRL